MKLYLPPSKARRTSRIISTAAAAVVLCCTSMTSVAEDILQVQGSTTFFSHLMKPNQADIEALAKIKIEVVPNKSIWGLIALLEGRAQLAMISAALEGEVNVARKFAPDLQYGRLKAFQISEVPISFPVHPSNPVRSLTDNQMRQILNGDITNWKDVGGANLPIRVVATQDGGGTVVAVRSQLLSDAHINAQNAIRPESARHVVQVVSQEPGAIGIAQHKLAQDANLPEITTETSIVQKLILVAREPIDDNVKAVVDATKIISDRQPQ